jgi:hypothetical protein
MHMAKHALVFIHGMGEQKAGWHTPALDVLKAALPNYATFKGVKLTDIIEPMPVLYSSFFTQLRETWKTDLSGIKAELSKQLEAADTPDREKVNAEFDSIAKAIGAGADNFIWTHAMDVVLYRFFRLARQQVNVKVANQMMAASDKKFTGWSVIAHSLGTGVAHNTLHTLYTDGISGPPLKPQETRPKVLAMVANVSRVLQLPTIKVFESKVMPGAAKFGRACDTYLNCRHLFDPFTFPQPFEPDSSWPTPGTFKASQYQHVRPSHLVINQLRNVHDLEHYLANPRVHVPIFRGIVGDSSIPPAEFDKACADFDDEQSKTNVDVIRDALQNMIPNKNEDWKRLLKTLFDLSGLTKP